MARQRRKSELLASVTEAGYIREATGSHLVTTLAAAAARGDTSLALADTTGLADGALLLVGEAEDMEVAQVNGAPVGGVVALRSPLARAHVGGEPAAEAARTLLGDLTEEGATLTLADGQVTPLAVAQRPAIVGLRLGVLAQRLTFAVQQVNAENLAAALGISELAIVGAGSATSPTTLDLLPGDFASAPAPAWYLRGQRQDGVTIEFQAWGVEVDPTALAALRLVPGEDGAPVAFRLFPTAGVRWLSWS